VNESDLSNRTISEPSFVILHWWTHCCGLAYWITQTSLVMWKCNILRKMQNMGPDVETGGSGKWKAALCMVP
jgi:hypothetical protein